MKELEIKYRTLRWGPCVIQLKARDDFREKLLAEARKSKISYGSRLAGHLQKEVRLNSKHYGEYFGEIFQIYNHALSHWMGQKKPTPYIVSDLWCNFQKANEFNPPHDHSGALSFVIYLKVPKEIKTECEAHQRIKSSAGPGCISFFIGDSDKRNSITQSTFFPEEGDMFIFPAWLKHWVYPFRSDCTRISVSGNITDHFDIKYFTKEGLEAAIEDVEKKSVQDQIMGKKIV